MRLKILFLTLKDYPERLEKQSPHLGSIAALLRLPMEIYYGVNGREVSIHETTKPGYSLLSHPTAGTALYNRAARTNGHPMSPGEFGCAWSHWEIYKRLLVDPSADAYIVLEDDFKQIVDDATLCASVLDLPEQFDVCRIAPSAWFPYEPTEQITDHYTKYKLQYSNCTTAYIVSKDGAAKLVAAMAHELSVPSDDLLSNMNLRYPGFRSYVATPILFTETGDPSVLARITASA